MAWEKRRKVELMSDGEENGEEPGWKSGHICQINRGKESHQ